MQMNLPKNVQKVPSGKFRAQMSIDGKLIRGTVRDTVAEAVADAVELKKEQKAAKVQRRQAQAGEVAAVREEHADHLQAGMDRSGGGSDADRLSRDFVALALRGSDVVCVPGVEYSKDIHLFRAEDDLGFDPELDVEPDDDVPTLVVELKSSSYLQPSHGKVDNPQVHFQGIDYAKEKGTIVLMLYIPKDVKEATPETLKRVTFWWKIAFGFEPKQGVYAPTLYGGKDPSKRGQKAHLLAEVLRKQVHRRAGMDGGLLPYAERKRVFSSPDHATGQAVIDAIEMQVLLPLGARFLPPLGGGEGKAEDCRIAFADGTTPNAQVKTVRLAPQSGAGFQVNLCRENGSIRNADGSKTKLKKPYTQGENAWYLMGVLDEDGVGLAEYWAPTEDDLLGAEISERLITDADGNRGVTGINVHPKLEDKNRLGDVVPNRAGYEGPNRTRAWLRKLGPITPFDEACALKATADAARRVARLAAKAARDIAATTAEAAAKTESASSTSVEVGTKRDAPLDAERAEKRKNCDIRGFFS